MHGSGLASSSGFSSLENQLQVEHAWAAFAFERATSQELKIYNRAPPTSEARAHCEEASSKLHAAIRETRQHGQVLGMSNTPMHLRTWKANLETALNLCKEIENKWLGMLDEWMMLGSLEEKTTTELKMLLGEVAPKFDALEACNRSLKADVAATKKEALKAMEGKLG